MHKTLEETLYPYLEIEGILTAALVSTEGLLIATAGDATLDLDAIAAYAATTEYAAGELSSQLDSGSRKTVSLDLPDVGLIIAPITGDLLLVLIGDKQNILAINSRTELA